MLALLSLLGLPGQASTNHYLKCLDGLLTANKVARKFEFSPLRRAVLEVLARVVDRAPRGLRVRDGSGRLMRIAASVPTSVTLSESVYARRRRAVCGEPALQTWLPTGHSTRDLIRACAGCVTVRQFIRQPSRPASTGATFAVDGGKTAR
jgi:hypothetical protein